MIFVAFDIITYAAERVALASGLENLAYLDQETLATARGIYATDASVQKALRNVAVPANSYLHNQLLKHATCWYGNTLFGLQLTVRHAIKQAAAFCPWYANGVKMTAAIEFYRTRSWLTREEATRCEEEIDNFIIEANGMRIKIILSILFLGEAKPSVDRLLRIDAEAKVQVEDEVWNWWRDRKNGLPCLASLFKLVAVMLPTSAPAERVFSLMRKMTINENASEECISLGTCLYVNSRNERK
jgi:hypothetical protein